LWLCDDETLDAWRESVDEVFASAYLGTDYIASDICAVQYDKAVEGVAYVDTPNGLIQPAAHVEGRVSSRVEHPNGTVEFLYQITAHVKTYEDSAVFNIVLSGPDGHRVVLEDSIALKEGKSFTAAGTSSLVVYDARKYTTLCIDFIDAGEFEENLCNEVRQ